MVPKNILKLGGPEISIPVPTRQLYSSKIVSELMTNFAFIVHEKHNYFEIKINKLKKKLPWLFVCVSKS